MKLYNRILSALLAVITILGALNLAVIGVAADEATQPSIPTTGVENVLKIVYNTPEEKVYGTESTPSRMKLMMERNGYQLYVDPTTGEIATVDMATGDILFSNPYDLSSSLGSESTKKTILSQLVVQFVDNGSTKYLYSFEEAAMRDQITVLNIKNGVRVEYTIGREESRKLVPRLISVTNFNKFIVTPLQEAVNKGEFDNYYFLQVQAFYTLKSLAAQSSKKAKDQLLKEFPICEKMDVMALNTDILARELNWVETQIKNYCEDYTFEQMDADHEETGYVSEDEKYPVFKMALEYSLTENGLSVRLPCNGLRYDMNAYTLESISILPYMGAGNSTNDGYNFYPDGAGTLFDFAQLNTKATTTVRGKIYGTDYAYHTITGTYQKAIRYPVYGTVATEKMYTFTYSVPEFEEDDEGNKIETGNILTYTTTVSNSVMSKEEIEKFIEDQDGELLSEILEESYKRGYVAVIESGESLAELSTYHAGGLSDYNTMMNYFNPKPKDTYDLADAISVTTSSSWTVVSDRKYTGNITINYMMLTDAVRGEAARAEDATYTYYDTTWLGMAEAYRDYLVGNGTLKKIENPEDDIPLYLEMFGALETKQTVMTMPVDMMMPLTTFENIYEIYEKLSSQDIGNINFKLTGFANGGMYSNVPADLKWEKAVGGKKGFEELVAKAQAVNAAGENHLGIYPDFDFAYVQNDTLFDSTRLKRDAVKTIDNRYSSLRQYSATKQTYVSFFQLAISPARYSHFYEKLLKNYDQYGWKSISIGSLGNALNSDFDEDDPYNREDSKKYTVQAFKDMKNEGYSLMTDGANAYTWAYVDHILNIDLDSSRYIKSSASVPFIGTVLHGYIQFAGTPLNEEGNTDYAILKALENGAGIYFVLSYQNASLLKEDPFLSQYYSVRYDIWEKDIVRYYQQLNGLLKDVQDKIIIDHKFLNDESERVLDIDELEDYIDKMAQDAAKEEQNKQQDSETQKVMEVADAWRKIEGIRDEVRVLLDQMKTVNNDELIGNYRWLTYQADNLLKEAKAYATALENGEENVDRLITKLNAQISSVKKYAVDILVGYEHLESAYTELVNALQAANDAKTVIANSTLSADVRDMMLAKADEWIAEASLIMTEAEAEFTRVEQTQNLTADVAINLAIEKLTQALTHENADIDAALKAATVEYVFDRDQLYAECEEILTEGDEEGDSEEDEDSQSIMMTSNQVVMVTYGDRDPATHQKTAYKSFILNYNNFAVRVTLGNQCYTIPAGGYVVIYH